MAFCSAGPELELHRQSFLDTHGVKAGAERDGRGLAEETQRNDRV